MNCPNCQTKMREVGFVNLDHSWHCDRCYWSVPFDDASPAVKRNWRANLIRAAQTVRVGNPSFWTQGLREMGLV
jgi:hypothetical protein